MHGLMFTLEHNLNVIVEIIHRRHTVHHVNVHCTQLPELMKLQYFFKIGLVILLGVEKFDSWGVFHVRVYRPQQSVDTSYTYSTRCAGNQVASAANTDYKKLYECELQPKSIGECGDVANHCYCACSTVSGASLRMEWLSRRDSTDEWVSTCMCTLEFMC